MMAKNHFIFTTKAIALLPVLTTKWCYYDLKTRGLGLYITATGVKTFFVYRRVHGKPERIIIGRCNEVTLEQARAKAGGIMTTDVKGFNEHANEIWQRGFQFLTFSVWEAAVLPLNYTRI